MKTLFKICTLMLLISPASCSSTSIASFQATSNIYDVIERQNVSLEDCLSQPENHYIVYFYSNTCSSCQRIKEHVVTFANLDVIKTYFLDTLKPENTFQKCSIDELVVGVDNVNDLYIAGTPTIIEVKDGITTSNVAGENDCLSLLETLENDK